MKLKQARELWLAEMKTRNLSKETLSSYSRNSLELLDHVASFVDADVPTLELDQLDRDAVVYSLDKYRTRPDGRGGSSSERANSSVATFYAIVKTFVTWCVRTGKLSKDPTESLPAPKTGKRVPKALSAVQCEAFLEAAAASRSSKRNQLIVGSGLFQGMRLAEITGLSISAFTPSAEDANTVKILGKGSKERVLPLHPAFVEALEEWLPVRAAILEKAGVETDALFITTAGKPMSRDGVGAVFDAAIKKAGLKKAGLRAHTARHSFATLAVGSRALDLEQTKTMLGHSSLAITSIYLSADNDKMRNDLGNLPLGRKSRTDEPGHEH